ncbi:MAG: hypothetical protein AB7S50_15085 [Bacteroidales bacterium]
MWETTKLEELTEKSLVKDLGRTKGREKFSHYLYARQRVVEQVLPEIKSIQPELTDHGEVHIANVLENSERLLGKAAIKFSGMDLYCLLMAILFHDVGNIFDREEHQRNISSIYQFARPDAHNFRQEQQIVMRAVGAHCGKAIDGSKDTLKYLNDEHLDRKKVRLQEISSVLRFADELAEGPQRTSLFMNQFYPYSDSSEIYHNYASITSVNIDRGNERIALTFNFNIFNNSDDGSVSSEKTNSLSSLIEFCFKRIIKLDQERKYAKHYCDLLAPFKKTTIAFNFWINDQPYDLGLNKLILTDLVIPGEVHKELIEIDSEYSVVNIISKIKRQCEIL